MINKIVKSAKEAVADIFDGATMMIGGFGEAGSPIELIHALIDQGAKNLTVVSNNTGSGNVGLAALIENRQVKKMICSFPRTVNSVVFPELYRAEKSNWNWYRREPWLKGSGQQAQVFLLFTRLQQ